MVEPKEFEIRQPRWLLVVSVVFAVIFSAVAIGVITATALEQLPFAVCGLTLLVSCAFMFIFGTGIVAYYTDSFAYRDGCFICKRIFRQAKTVPVETIFCATLFLGRSSAIVFKDKNNEKVLTVTDADELLKSLLFKYVLYYYKITVTDHRYNIIDLDEFNS